MPEIKQSSKFYSGASQKVGGYTAVGHEWHRGIASDVVLEHGSPDEPIHIGFSPEAGATRSWPFALQVPSSLVASECNSVLDGNGCRNFSSPFCRAPRPPPPTLRNNRNASIEWVVEATIRLVDPTQASRPDLGEGPSDEELDRPPAFGDESSTAVTDERGFALSAPPNLLISRAVFPLVPADEHLVPLGTIPTFGQSPLKRTETGGAELVDVAEGSGADCPNGECEDTMMRAPSTDDTEGGVPIDLERITTTGGTRRQIWHKEVPRGGGPLGISKGSIISQVLVPLSLCLSRKTPSLRLQFRLMYVPPSSTLAKLSGRRRQNGSATERTSVIPLEMISVRIASRTLTRGGGRSQPYMLLKEVQKHEFSSPEIAQAVTSTTTNANGRGEGGGKWMEIEVDLQNPGGKLPSPATMTKGKGKEAGHAHMPLAMVPPSFRTPNVEYEVSSLSFSSALASPDLTLSPFLEQQYIVTINVHPVHEPLFCAARFPLQIGSGEKGPSTGGVAPPSFEVSESMRRVEEGLAFGEDRIPYEG